ncbi:MAG: tRNA adenosine(34) deaminase TadA [Chloroflexi bacterium]|jgi:tRNA(adenine34) deaminase|nr:tRNA adenosine(34) deaminase TadA [Chloroflexota bacterium]MBV6437030.1 tRNA-specific adenosine deaminase [Anaerolineae bacterium]MDL1915863.1 tRNA adenosine(34) deaminase TadA [Anaerolineae bacterium CFX4]OQY86404.1 MAG: tRNA adenosine(34) deaminase TadA [Anaerolineae bacterium UTCFX5]MBW7879786.1 tRNA adenosine(34) deaminase TadA [Anaerolineae bacterium]
MTAHKPRFFDDVTYMRIAIDEARAALATGDVPVGAVAVRNGEVIGRGRNRREADGDPTAHAEILALRQAAQAVGEWRLEEVTLYCTLEPCCMCAGAMVQARLWRLVYGALDPKAGCAGSVMDVLRQPKFNHCVDVYAGVLADECAALLDDFFKSLR